VNAFAVYRRIIGPVADARVQGLLRIGSESAVFAAYSDAYRYGLVAEVRRLFNDVLQIALANSDILEDHLVEWAKKHFNILIDGKVNLVKGWIKNVCDEQDHSKPLGTAEDFEEFVFRKTWRAPRLIWMKPSGNCSYDPATAWAREDGPTTERLVEGLSGRFIQLLGIDLDKIAGDAHLRLAKEGRPPQAPKRIATERVTQEVPAPQPPDTKEWEAPTPALELRIQQGQPLMESSAPERASRLAQQAQSEQGWRALGSPVRRVAPSVAEVSVSLADLNVPVGTSLKEAKSALLKLGAPARKLKDPRILEAADYKIENPKCTYKEVSIKFFRTPGRADSIRSWVNKRKSSDAKE
jgi:hypothetical protein